MQRSEEEEERRAGGLALVWAETDISGWASTHKSVRYWSNSGWSFNWVKLFTRTFANLQLNLLRINDLAKQTDAVTRVWASATTLITRGTGKTARICTKIILFPCHLCLHLEIWDFVASRLQTNQKSAFTDLILQRRSIVRFSWLVTSDNENRISSFLSQNWRSHWQTGEIKHTWVLLQQHYCA